MARFTTPTLIFVLLAIVASACGPTTASPTAGGPSVSGRQSPATPAGSPASAAASAQHTTLKVAYVPVLAFGPLYRAIAKGYFSATGIDVDLQVVQSASDAMAFLGTGQIDVALGNVGAPLFNAVNRGVNVRIVGGNSVNPPDASTLSAAPLVLRKQLADDGAIKSPSDLKGHKVAINAIGGIQEYSLAHVMEGSQLTLQDADVELLPFPDMPAALSNGAVDAAMLPEPFSAATRGNGVAAVLVANPVPGATVTAVFYGENLLKPEQAAVAKAFLAAMRKAANELQTDQDIFSQENLAIWAQYTGVAEAQIQKGAPYTYSRDLALDVASVLDQQRFLLRTGRLDFSDALPQDRFIDTRFLE